MTLLSQDDRLDALDNHPKYASHRVVLTKMHLEQIIKRAELDVFAQALMPHQKAVRFGIFGLHRSLFCVVLFPNQIFWLRLCTVLSVDMLYLRGF